MPRPPLARERVLDAFEELLIRDGERAATLDATAKAAGVSKGGLLYHFASKEELSEGLIARLDRLVAADVAEMAQAPDGPVAYFIRTSVMDDDPLDRAIIAVSRLAQGGNTAAPAALHAMRALWADTIRPHVRDEASLDLVMLVSDGLYFNNTLDVPGPPRSSPGATPSPRSSRSCSARPSRPERTAQTSSISICEMTLASISAPTCARSSSGTRESTVSTESA